MPRNLSISLRLGAAALVAAAWSGAINEPALAQQPPAPAAVPAAPASTAMTVPAMTGPLVANPNPISFDGGPLNKIYLTGTISGLGLFQSDPGVPPLADHRIHGDLSNGLVALQNTEGLFQFFVQAGAYSFPALGVPYFQSWKTTGDFFGPVPVAYAKVAPTDTFSVQAGKLPTLIGLEYGFSFQNMNIERGLLWNQEPIVSRGVQANWTLGPLALSGSLTDGFYSDSYNWLTGSAAWTINKENTLTVVAGGNVDHTDKNLLKTPWFLNNSRIINFMYAYNSAPWILMTHLQVTSVPGNPFLGATRGASTFGGAVYASYALNDNVSLAGRWEYIGSTGSVTNGAPNLLYGPGSAASSFTITPTWQDGIYFLRADTSVVKAFATTPGSAFGKTGTSQTQVRFVLETGIIF